MHARRTAPDAKPLALRAGSGLGDAIYLQSVARWFVGNGHKVEVCTGYGDVFRPLGDAVVVSPFRRDRIDRNAHYSMRRGTPGTTQFEDCCIQAGITDVVDFSLGWREMAPRWRYELLAAARGRPIIAVALPRAPFARHDGYGMELLPDMAVLQRIIDRIAANAYIIQLGSTGSSRRPFYRFANLARDLADKTTVCDLIDIASLCHGFLGYCSFFVPLAESLDHPALFVWSRRGLKSSHQLVRQITPKKILHRAASRFVYDDCSLSDCISAADALLGASRCRATV